jgi:hypothetical protein
MDELHHRGQQGIGFALVAAGAGGEDYQRRAQALAATEDNMLAELVVTWFTRSISLSVRRLRSSRVKESPDVMAASYIVRSIAKRLAAI